MVAAVLLWVGPWSLFATCPVGEIIMKCHWCCVALIPIAIILLVLGALQLLAKQEESRKFLAIASVASFYLCHFAAGNADWRLRKAGDELQCPDLPLRLRD